MLTSTEGCGVQDQLTALSSTVLADSARGLAECDPQLCLSCMAISSSGQADRWTRGWFPGKQGEREFIFFAKPQLWGTVLPRP